MLRKSLLLFMWLVLVGLLAVGTELRACGVAAEGTQYLPYSVDCMWASGCGGYGLCESDACYGGPGCVGW